MDNHLSNSSKWRKVARNVVWLLALPASIPVGIVSFENWQPLLISVLGWQGSSPDPIYWTLPLSVPSLSGILYYPDSWMPLPAGSWPHTHQFPLLRAWIFRGCCSLLNCAPPRLCHSAFLTPEAASNTCICTSKPFFWGEVFHWLSEELVQGKLN